MDWGSIVAIVAFCCSLSSIAAFYFGRRNAAQEEAREEAKVALDLKYIKDTVGDQTKALEALGSKFDDQNEKREKEYRELLVKFTEIQTKHRLLREEVTAMKQEIALYHHHS